MTSSIRSAAEAGGRKIRPSRKSRDYGALLYPSYMIWPAAIIFTVFFMLPVLISFVMSLTDWNLSRFYEPSFNGLDNFAYIFSDNYFALAVKNTFIFAVCTALLKTLAGLLLALAVNRSLKTRNFLRMTFYLPAVLSMIVIGILFKTIFRADGLFNHLLDGLGLGAWTREWVMGKGTAMGIVILAEVWRWAGFNMAVFLAGLQGIPHDYYEAARIDGASPRQQLWRITLPLLISSFTVNLVFNTIGGLKVFEQVFIITGGGPGFDTRVLGTYVFENFSKGLLGRSTAMSLILFIMVYGIATLVNRVLQKKEVEY